VRTAAAAAADSELQARMRMMTGCSDLTMERWLALVDILRGGPKYVSKPLPNCR